MIYAGIYIVIVVAFGLVSNWVTVQPKYAWGIYAESQWMLMAGNLVAALVMYLYWRGDASR